jgi:hypothetical protein
MSDPAFQRAQQYYARIRQSAFARARDDIVTAGLADVPLRLADCDRHTLAVWRATWRGSHPSGWGNWDWEALLRSAWKQPSAFHLAIWSGSILCGLAVGRVSRRDRQGVRNALSIDRIESGHDAHHPLRGAVAPIVVTAGDVYGRAVGASLLRLIQPLPGVIDLYGCLGFTPVWQRHRLLYCERRIER